MSSTSPSTCSTDSGSQSGTTMSTAMPSPIAICGIGLRLPGGIDTTSALYDFLVAGKDARATPDVPRYNSNAFKYRERDSTGYRTLPAEGYWLDWAEITGWDPALFASLGVNISQQELEKMDPQQRILLRVIWEALENAGESSSIISSRSKLCEATGPQEARSSMAARIGCYIGGFGDDWHDMHARDALDPADAHRLAGHGDFALANRASHVFGLGGPSMTVRTACSASGVSLHLACQAIRAGECDAAVVAGANVILSPEFTLSLAEQGVLSPDASCRTFDAQANGYARAEAVACLYVKRYDLAVRDASPIRAVVRGSATNCDGRTAGLTTPNPEAQEALIRAAYRQAGIEESQVAQTAMVECHGTGTTVGDSVETCAVASVFGDKGIIIGSVKPALGHAEAASGIVSVAKAVLSLENRIILPNIKFETPNHQVPFKAGRLTVPTAPMCWPVDRLERISVNCFGIGGTNVHIILDSAASLTAASSASPRLSPELNLNGVRRRNKRKPTLLLFSASSEESLQKTTELHKAYLQTHPEHLERLAYTLTHRRLHLPLRTLCVVDEHGNAEAAGPRQIHRCPPQPQPVTFVFTGQGDQWARMGVELLKFYPSIRDDIKAMDAVLQLLPPGHRPTWTIQSELARFEPSSRLREPEFALPVTAAVQIVLVNLLSRYGVRPAAVIGYASGEVAAAYAAGSLSLEHAIMVAYYQGFVCRPTHSPEKEGGMLSIGLNKEATRGVLGVGTDGSFGDGLGFACDNSCESVTLSGTLQALHRAMETMQRARPDVPVRLLDVRMAYHDPVHMREAGEEYYSLLEPFLRPRRARVALHSSVSGGVLGAAADFGPSHWRRSLTGPVLFRQATESLLAASATASVLVEIGPHPALGGHLEQSCAEAGVASPPYLSLLVRSEASTTSFLAALGGLHCHGVAVEWPDGQQQARMAQQEHQQQPLSDLAPYQWNLSRTYWPDWSLAMKAWRLRTHAPHELLGTRSHEGGGGGSNDMGSQSATATWRCRFDVERSAPWLMDHRVGRDVLFPASCYIAMAGEVARQLNDDGSGEQMQPAAYTVRELSITTALVLRPGNVVEILTVARRTVAENEQQSPSWEFSIQSCHDGAWLQHCSGVVKYAATRVTNQNLGLRKEGNDLDAEDEDDFVRMVDTAAWYRALARVGHNYGPDFRGLRDIRASVSRPAVRAIVENRMPKTASELGYLIHPATMDKVIQSWIVAVHSGQPRLMKRPCLPTYADEITVAGLGSNDLVDVSGSVTANNSRASVTATKRAASAIQLDEPVLSITGLRWSSPDLDGEAETATHGAVQMVWKPDIDLVGCVSTLLRRDLQAGSKQKENQVLLETLCIICATEIQKTFSAMESKNPEFLNKCPAHFVTHLSWLKSYISSWPSATLGLSHGQQGMVETRDLLQGTPASAAAELLCQCASNAAAILTGDVEPLALFLENNALHRLYDWMNSLWSYDSLLALLSHQRGNHLRILEIGAGTGGLTARVLQSLASTAEDGQFHGTYVFTDVSAGFFPSARERFRRYARQIDYRVLDIARDPAEQGFQGDYDLVIASNVLHATPDLSQTLRHVRSLLKADGRLLMQELACETKWINLIMGFLPGWWLGAADQRAAEPYMSSSDVWNERLCQAGFLPLESWVLDANIPYQCNATMLARPDIRAIGQTPQRQRVALLVGDGAQDMALSCASELEIQARRLGFDVTRSRIDQKQQAYRAHSIVVSLLDLGSGPAFLHGALSEPRLQMLLGLLDAVKEADATLVWLTRPCQISPVSDPTYAQILGVARTARQETGIRMATLELDSTGAHGMEAVCKVMRKVSLRGARHGDTLVEPDMEFAFASGLVLTPRAAWFSVPRKMAESEEQWPAKDAQRGKVLRVSRLSQLDSLVWSNSNPHQKTSTSSKEVRVRIEAAGLNFKDVLIAMGIEGSSSSPIAGDPTPFLGCEASGIVVATGASVSNVQVGDRVMVMAPHAGCLATLVSFHEDLCASIPENLSFSDAASMPCVYTTVLRALADKARLSPKQTILIHSAAGGVGLAALAVARWLGIGPDGIYATVGSEAKAGFLVQEWGLPRSHIFCSRDSRFERQLMAATRGRGVDVVLNALSGELLQASWRCVAPCGTFVELGRRDIASRGRLAMEPLGENRTFVGIDMAHLAIHDAPEIARLLRRVVRLYEQGAIAPVAPLRVFPGREVVAAFRCLYAGTNVGKIVIDMSCVDHEEANHVEQPWEQGHVDRSLTRSAVPATFSSHDAYILVGGLRGLTAAIARWMACNGARNLVFLSRSAAQEPEGEGAMLLAELRGMGCTVAAFSCDVTNEEAVHAAVARIKATGCRIAGLIQLAMVLADVELAGLTVKQWHAANDPKVAGTWNLHRALPGDLDFFVLVGSMLGITGRVGQANYSAANAFLDSFVQYRLSLALPCSVLDVGFVQDIGALTRKQDVLEAVVRAGVRPLTEQDMLDGLQLAMARSRCKLDKSDALFGAQVFRCGAQVSLGFDCTKPLEDPHNRVFWKHDARFVHYSGYTVPDSSSSSSSSSSASAASSAASSSSGLADFMARVAHQPTELDTRSSALFLAHEIARRVLGYLMREDGQDQVETLLSSSLASVGMDSLMTIEIRNWWRLAFGCQPSLLQLTSAVNFTQLGKLAARQVKERLVAEAVV